VSGPSAVLTRVTAVLVLAAVMLVVLAWVLQRRLIYLPSREPVPAVARMLPGSEDVSFRTDGGLRLVGWFLPGARRGDRAGVQRQRRRPVGPRPAGRRARPFRRVGAAVRLPRIRRQSRLPVRDPGWPSTPEPPAYLDSRPDVRSESVVYYGESLGAGVAIGLAVERPPAALVLRSPFTSLADVGRRHYPYLPVRQLPKDRYESVGRITAVRCPILVVAGSADDIVPVPRPATDGRLRSGPHRGRPQPRDERSGVCLWPTCRYLVTERQCRWSRRTRGRAHRASAVR